MLTETKEKPINKISLKDRKCGALWIKKNQVTGNKTLSLSITLQGKEHLIIGLQNDFFNDNPEKQPNYKLYLSEDTYNNLIQESEKLPQTDEDKKIEI